MKQSELIQDSDVLLLWSRRLRYLRLVLHQLPLYQLLAGSGVGGGDAGFRSDWWSAGGAVCLSSRLHPPAASPTPTERRGRKSDLRVSVFKAINSCWSKRR